MTEAPKRIMAWSDVALGLAGTWSVTRHAENAEPYILAAEHDRIVAEKNAEIARLREALIDATASLVAAESSYRAFARRHKDLRPKAEVDPFFTTRMEDYRKAANRARAALGESDE